MKNISLSDLKDHQFVLFTKDGGIALDQTKNSGVAVLKSGRNWKVETFSLNDVRNVENTKKEYTAPHHLPSRVQGAGARIGAGIRDDLEHRKAKKQTGITVFLKSLETPSLFINFVDDTDRSRAFEALTLALEGNLEGQSFQNIPRWAEDLFSGKSVGLTGGKLQTSDDPAMKYIPGKSQTSPENEHGISPRNFVFLIVGAAALGLVIILLSP